MTSSKKRKIDPLFELGCKNIFDDGTIVKDLKSEYNGSTNCNKHDSDCYKLTMLPFRVCTLYNIFEEDTAIGLLSELQKLKYTFKENDLLSLHQTIDLNKVNKNYISKTREFIYTKLKSIIEDISGSKFNDTIDLHGIKFLQHNNLLCHSDCLDTRHTAFILYLVPKTWNPECGGLLDLFNCDENNEPTDIAHSLCPTFNSFSWFEVSNHSWHQVSEVMEDEIRWSISGWFHSDKPPIVLPKSELMPQLISEPVPGDVEILQSWISLKYLNLEINTEIQQQFQDDSEVSLEEFLIPEKYTLLCEELVAMKWHIVGPRNKQFYKKSDKQLTVVSEFMDLLKSDAFAVLLSHCTGLPLSKEFDDPDCSEFSNKSFGTMDLTLSRWEPGFYTLLRDQETENLPEKLHLFYHADVFDEYDSNVGGYVSFISNSDEEPLLVIPPQSNTLSLVFTRPDEFGFTKYVNSKLQKPYYCFSGQYMPRTPIDES